MVYLSKQLLLKDAAAEYSVNNHKAIIACVERDTLKAFFPDWEWLKLGYAIALELRRLPKADRRTNIVDIVNKTVNTVFSDRIIVENIDLLFSPEYALDVLNLFSMLGKAKRLIVLWEGMFKDGVITYAEPGYADYHRYDLKNYDVYYMTR